jgi:uncharacterized protein (TIGR02421 family)
MSFLMRVTPVNSLQEWERFKENQFDETPRFHYRLIPLDPEIEKRRLYNIRIDRIDDPSLAYIFRDKRLELDKQLTMLEEMETRNFKYVGQSLYGVVDDEAIGVADQLLQSLDSHGDGKKMLDCHAFAARAELEIAKYRAKFPGIDLRFQIRKDISGVMVSKSRLLISEQFAIPEKRVEALIQHEVGTHLLTYCNGCQQPLRQMYAGFAGYEQLQEGLAVLAEYLVDGLTLPRLKLLAGRVMAVDAMVNGAEFIEVFRTLTDNFHFDPKTAFFITMRVFRGGGLTKDALYLTGLIQLLRHLKKGGDLELLYAGKFHLKHVPVIRELMQRNILKTPLLGTYLKSPEAEKRIERLKHITNLTELLPSGGTRT